MCNVDLLLGTNNLTRREVNNRSVPDWASVPHLHLLVMFSSAMAARMKVPACRVRAHGDYDTHAMEANVQKLELSIYGLNAVI
jgi:hypothetical protein